MSDRDEDDLPIPSRRDFLKGVGLAGAGASLLTDKAAEAATAADAKVVSGTVRVTLDLNGQKRTVDVEPRTTLLSAIRDRLDPPLSGPKMVCGQGSCGACTVLLGDKPVYSCLILAIDAAGKPITTVEGLGTPEKMNAVQQAFVEKDALMCGFCTPGFVTTLTALLKTTPHPTADEVRAACKGNFCRCGTYPHIVAAALAAGKV